MRQLATATAQTSASPEAVWRVWTERRADWHPRLEWATLEGSLAPGSKGRWKPDRARPVGVTVSELEEGRRLVYTGVHGLPVAMGHYVHTVEPLGSGGSQITHTMSLSGPAAPLIARFFAAPLGVSASQEAVDAVARLAEAAA